MNYEVLIIEGREHRSERGEWRRDLEGLADRKKYLSCKHSFPFKTKPSRS